MKSTMEALLIGLYLNFCFEMPIDELRRVLTQDYPFDFDICSSPEALDQLSRVMLQVTDVIELQLKLIECQPAEP
jgi:hypothetical protein